MRENAAMIETRLILTAMFLIFMTLKLTGQIAWSWWWITSPIWIPLIIGFVGLLIYLIYLRMEEP